ncbi:adenylyltransferase and sulfurtransferase [Lishizhenia tianjinensis]|uniref:Adenylyltransferase and sulfurtransferase n=1 Tax=Lishizhenia tianjinensis TaxID=477690 RepID=A0A1I6XZR8_9FLAO|nr:rhodanese-like domain-containing protein [Lishizhenia tianjinensis]SFT43810.1 adenylyltransferase and sulfurtransferase [Lishizhenia tianjinensis]
MKTINVNDLKALQQNQSLIILDVREEYEYNICRIEGAVNIPMGEITERVDELEREDPVYVCCKSGKRAEAVCNLLITDYAFENLVVIEGGVEAYAKEIDNSLELY